MTHNHTCPRCRKVFSCADRECSDDDPCYECLQAERNRLKDELAIAEDKLSTILNDVVCVRERPKLCTLNRADEARLYLESEPMVGTKVIYLGVLHEVVDAGPTQGRRLAAIEEGKP